LPDKAEDRVTSVLLQKLISFVEHQRQGEVAQMTDEGDAAREDQSEEDDSSSQGDHLERRDEILDKILQMIELDLDQDHSRQPQTIESPWHTSLMNQLLELLAMTDGQLPKPLPILHVVTVLSRYLATCLSSPLKETFFQRLREKIPLTAGISDDESDPDILGELRELLRGE
jgi:hypothetical protein